MPVFCDKCGKENNNIFCKYCGNQLQVNSVEIENIDGVNFEMVYIKGGEFMMGSNKGHPEEKPVHKVRVSSFYIGKYVVTNKEYRCYRTSMKMVKDDSPADCVT
jgi:formylglycine-generating enzyme required for sulfatase activity